jgi:4-hydroxymandelate synthase
VTVGTGPFEDMLLDHVEVHVTDLDAAAGWLSGGYGLHPYAQTPPGAAPLGVRSVAVGGNDIRLVLSRPVAAGHPAHTFLDRHGDGVADIALGVADAAAAYTEAVRRGAIAVAPPRTHGDVVTATVLGIGDVAHTFVERATGTDARVLPGLVPVAGPAAGPGAGLGAIDHFAVCVPAGDLANAVEFYRRVLDFDLIFSERVTIGRQAMTTQVVQSRSGAVTLTLIEPDVSQVPGHIDEFLRDHRGAGVQHIAFSADSIVESVGAMRDRGVGFLATPTTYYTLLPERLELARYSVEELQQLDILVDSDHHGQLYQIFTRSVHPRNTWFLEIIERLGATSFGSGNIRALYQAVELQRNADQSNAA